MEIKYVFYNITFQKEGSSVIGLTVLCRKSKEGDSKTLMMGVLQDPIMCSTFDLHLFHMKSIHLRTNIPPDHTFFLGYLDASDKSTISILSTTIVNWAKEHIIARAGTKTTKYKLHSIRLASSTKATELGFSASDIKQHANWREASNKFERCYYYKPTHQVHSSVSLIASMLNTKNHIAWKVGVAPTEIMLGTTPNCFCQIQNEVLRSVDSFFDNKKPTRRRRD